ncbi:uncharacterized protein [Macrobrachium rosenbergii]|uniref:uncharacterized protein n=1 Tax=Macrobrachium rosenbergii TaxID=79674 RepID=UPI0034D671BD
MSLCAERGLDTSACNVWGLRNSSGAALLRFSPEDFGAFVGSQLGRFLFQELQSLVNNGAGKQWSSPVPSRDVIHDVTFDSSYDVTEGLGATPPPFGGYDDSSSSFGGYNDEELADMFSRVPQEVWDLLPDSLQDFSMQDHPLQVKYEEPLAEASYPLPTAYGHLGSSPVAFGAPVPSLLPETTSDVFKKIPTNTRRKERGPKSWEFLVRLLADKRTNPSIIRWEDEATATFRLTQPKIIAQMWGGRADKPSLSLLVNFARGLLKYHYNTGALEAVSERQLVYRCGPKALKYLQELRSELP